MNPTTTVRFGFSWAKILSTMLLLLPTVLGGCLPKATLTGKVLQGIGGDGTAVLVIVTRTVTREEMEKGGEDAEHTFLPMYQDLLRSGVSEQELVDGKVVIVLYQYYRHNRSRVHDWLDWAIVEKGGTVKKHSLVEVQLRKPYTIVTRVVHEDAKERGCDFVKGDRGGFAVADAISQTG